MTRDDQDHVDHYGATYDGFASQIYAEIREEAFGEDIGQTGWLTSDEQDWFISWLGLGSESRLLDVACGSGGPTLRIVRETGCSVVGVDLHVQAVAAARDEAAAEGLEARASFRQGDVSPDRERVLREWHRVLKPEGRVVFTDPVTITGPITDEEMRIRSSIGFFLFVPRGVDEELLGRTGFDVREVHDRTENMARLARRWLKARDARATDLRNIEGEETFSGQQVFFDVAARLAEERRLSRFAFAAVVR